MHSKFIDSGAFNRLPFAVRTLCVSSSKQFYSDWNKNFYVFIWKNIDSILAFKNLADFSFLTFFKLNVLQYFKGYLYPIFCKISPIIFFFSSKKKNDITLNLNSYKHIVMTHSIHRTTKWLNIFLKFCFQIFNEILSNMSFPI